MLIDCCENHEEQPQIYKGDPRTCAIFIPAWGLNWGSLGFPRNQNNRGSSSAYVTSTAV